MLLFTKITKKLHFSKALSFFAIAVILITALASPSFAEDMEGKINTAFYWFTTDDFFSDLTRYTKVDPEYNLGEWTLGGSVTGSCAVFPFTGIYNSTNDEQLFFAKFYTYTVEMEFTNSNVTTWRNPTLNNTPHIRFLKNYTDNLTDSVLVSDVLPSSNYSCVVANSLGTNRTIVTLTFNTSADSYPLDGYKYVAPLLQSYSEGSFYLGYFKVTGTYDPDGDKFQQALIDQLSIIGAQNHEDLTKIHDAIADDSEGDDFDTSVGGAVGGMEQAENSIFNTLDNQSADVTIGDQSFHISMDSNALSALDSFIGSYSEGQFNSTAAIYINDVFNTFLPYLAFPIFISLALGVSIWFIGGRHD